MSIKKTYKDWSESAERLVLYADIMGFKNRVLTTEHEELRKSLQIFREDFTKQASPLQIEDYLRFVQFSDSILAVAQSADKKMLNLITKFGVRLMQISSEMGFPIKGVLSKGMFTFDTENQLYFGQPLVDAYLLHEEIKFYGIVVHHTAENLVKQFGGNAYCNNQIFIAKGKVNHYHLRWNMFKKTLDEGDNTTDCIMWLDKIAETVSGEPRMYIDHTKEILVCDKNTQKPKAKKLEVKSTKKNIKKH
ncbi:MAG: hypothetical protein IJM66_10735 [Muribaculaceae bacterium]|nr:hypothetical protein [Muribaculaceae bacterium]